jgi:hypothetical protein
LTSAWEIFEKLEEQVAQAPILICRAVNLKGTDEYNKRKFEPLKEIYSTYVESLARLLRFACLLVLFMFFSNCVMTFFRFMAHDDKYKSQPWASASEKDMGEILAALDDVLLEKVSNQEEPLVVKHLIHMYHHGGVKVWLRCLLFFFLPCHSFNVFLFFRTPTTSNALACTCSEC